MCCGSISSRKAGRLVASSATVFVGGMIRMRYHFAKTNTKDIRPYLAIPDSFQDITRKGVEELELKSKHHKASNFQTSTASSLGSSFQTGALQIDDCQTHDQSTKPLYNRVRKMYKRAADMEIVDFIVSNNLSFNLLRSKEFREACTAVANTGPGYEPPESEMAWMGLLGKLKDEAETYVHSVSRTWEKSGCTLMLDSCIKARDAPNLNLLAAWDGVVYLKSSCTVGHVMDDCSIFEFISSVIYEIGFQNVVQFVSDDNAICTSVVHMIEQKYLNIFKINSVAHIINLMFEEFTALEEVAPIVKGVKRLLIL